MRRRTLPMVLLLLGVYLLVGCIPIPSTQQFMNNGQAKPSYAFGRSKDAAIRLGYTRFADARAYLDQQMSGTMKMPAELFGETDYTVTPAEIDRYWQKLDNGRYVIPYSLRTGFLIWPICFSAETLTADRWLVVHVDGHGVVTDYEMVSDRAKFGTALNRAEYPPSRWRSTPLLEGETTQPSTRPN